ncbi:uncharacterized protein IL334_003349 [Kwoniella shivajii]|uniref:DUF7729 domain-containing protein n=1 Tax=Kwoniella shivajii TaxID=564305 RepID=A0ABZ1CXC4_9TREE|nr:hypothetical protein IL334_003349 [Kwoniella shivajii]
MHARSTLIALAASTSYAVALSTGCTTQLASLALGDLGSCLQLTSLLPVLSGSSNSSVISTVNTYLTSLCSSSTPTCANGTLTSAQSSVQSACASDFSEGGTSAVEIQGLIGLLGHYDQIYDAGCSKNATTNDYCIVDALNTVSNATGQTISLSYITSILSGDSTVLSGLETVYNSGSLCTGCVSGIYYEALQANSSIASTSFGQGLTSKCGSSFGTIAPNSTTSSDTTAASSSAASSGSSSTGEMTVPLATFGMAGAVIAALAVGAASVL